MVRNIHYRAIILSRAACRLNSTLVLHSVGAEVISFIAKLLHVSNPNNLAGMQSEKRSRRGTHEQSSDFASLKIHGGIWLQPVNQADNAARSSML
jgi:hypothetical protein